MQIEELRDTLLEKGFVEEKRDTGIEYSTEEGHIKLICYIEPDIEVEFISLYRWKNNEVKGIHNLSINNLKRSDESLSVLFKKTKENMPELIGENIMVHMEVDKVIGRLF